MFHVQWGFPKCASIYECLNQLKSTTGEIIQLSIVIPIHCKCPEIAAAVTGSLTPVVID